MSSQYQVQFNAQMSLYIPHVFPNFTAEYIASMIEYMEIGKVDHVDLVAKLDKRGNYYNAAYIHFAYWFAGPIAENFQARVLDPTREARIIHDDPWYWIVLENTAKKYLPGNRKICIDLNQIAPGLPAEYDDEIELSEDEEVSVISEESTMSISEYEDHPIDMEDLLQEAQQEIIEKELDLQAEMNTLETIMQKVMESSTLGEAKDAICNELWGTSYEDYSKGQVEVD